MRGAQLASAAVAAAFIVGCFGGSYWQRSALRAEARKNVFHEVIAPKVFDLSLLPGAAVVMLGDSLTERAPWNEITGCLTAVNRGVAGDTTAGIKARLGQVKSLRPAAVFVMAGVNDLIWDRPNPVENMRAILAEIAETGAAVYWLPALPVAERFAYRVANDRIAKFNESVSLAIAGIAGVKKIDLRPAMSTASGALHDEFASDGVHLNDRGYRVWRATIAPYVASVCGTLMSRQD